MADHVYPNPDSNTKCPTPVYTHNVTSLGVNYRCIRCYGWVHAKCSGLLNAAQYGGKLIGPATPVWPHDPAFDTINNNNNNNNCLKSNIQCIEIRVHPHHLQLPNRSVMTARSIFYSSTIMELGTSSSTGEKQDQSGSDTGVNALT